MSRHRWLALLLLGAVACGGTGAGGVAPAAWTDAICERMTRWSDSLEAGSSRLESDIASLARGDLAGVRDLVVGFLEEAIAETDEVRGDLEAAGAPAVDRGQRVARVLDEGFEDMRALLVSQRDETTRIPVSDPRRLAERLEEVGLSLAEGADDIGVAIEEAIGELDVPELDRAFEQNPACGEFAA